MRIQALRERPVWFLHAARDGNHQPFADEVAALEANHPAAQAHVFYSQPGPEDPAVDGNHHVGRLDVDKIEALLGTLNADFYFCGPVSFAGSLMGDLAARGVPDSQLMSESFGPQR